jgi:hypothetical protein
VRTRTILYTVIILVVLHVAFPYFIPLDVVYHNRSDYNLGLNNIKDLDVTLEKIKLEISQKKIKNYGIILGDSVFYGSPGNSDQAVNVFMEDELKKATGDPNYRLFNLAFPAMQNGDLYVMLLKLDRLGISTDNLILNTRYSSFVPRNPGPRAVFWFYDDLRKMDRESYNKVLPQLKASGTDLPSTFYEITKNWLNKDVLPSYNPYAYRDYFRKMLKRITFTKLDLPIPDDALGDIRPYYEKDYLEKYIQMDEVKDGYNDQPFDMTSSNYDIYFMDKIMEHQKNKKTLVVLTGANQTLLKPYIEKPGYKANLASLDRYFGSKPVQYLNLEGVIPDTYFTDHTHLIPDGYRKLSEIILQHYPK